MADFGNSFRSAREATGITLDQVAQETRISARFLRAIENEEFEILPGGLFNRGFIRNYASKVGLDPEAAVQAYEALTSEVQAEASAIHAHAAIEQRDRYVAPLAVGGLVVMIVLFYVFDLRNAQTQQEAAVGLATAAPSPPAQTFELPNPTLQPRAAAPPDPAPTPAEPGAVQDRDPGIVVQIRVREATWLLVQSDGQEEEFLLNPGTSRLYTADEALGLRIGNAAGVTLNWNGQEFDNLGGTGQVLTLNITAEGIGGLAENRETLSTAGPAA